MNHSQESVEVPYGWIVIAASLTIHTIGLAAPTILFVALKPIAAEFDWPRAVPSLAYALLMEPLGFVLSSVVLIGSLSLFYGARDLRVILAISVGVPVAIYYTFTVALKTFLPEAPWS